MPRSFESISMMEFRTHPGEILDRVADRGESFIVERNGQRKACLVPLSLFLPDISPERIAAELASLTKANEIHRTSISDARELVLTFDEATADGGRVPLEIILPHGYPSSCPRVYARLDLANVPHRWPDGSLCIFGIMSAWNPGKLDVASVLGLARRWLSNYYDWRRTGNWPQQGGAHD